MLLNIDNVPEVGSGIAGMLPEDLLVILPQGWVLAVFCLTIWVVCILTLQQPRQSVSHPIIGLITKAGV